jgi:hypothetical protein
MLEEQQSPRPARPPNQLEKEEAWLWRIALLFVVLLGTGLAAVLWERLESLPYHLGFLSIAVLCVAIAFAGFAYGRKRRVAELKDLVRGLQERASSPTDEQIDQLGQVIARSQRRKLSGTRSTNFWKNRPAAKWRAESPAFWTGNTGRESCRCA